LEKFKLKIRGPHVFKHAFVCRIILTKRELPLDHLSQTQTLEKERSILRLCQTYQAIEKIESVYPI